MRFLFKVTFSKKVYAKNFINKVNNKIIKTLQYLKTEHIEKIN